MMRTDEAAGRMMGTVIRGCASFALGLILVGTGTARAGTLYTQPAASPVGSVRLSDCTSDTYYCVTYGDYFTLPQAGVLSGITWQGAYLYPSYNVDQSTFVPSPSATSFVVFLYSVSGYTCRDPNCDAADIQGGVLRVQERPTASQAHETHVATQRGFVDPGSLINTPLTLSVYSYQDQLNTPVDLAAGKYVLELWAFTDYNTGSSDPQDQILWTWTNGSGGDSLSFGYGGADYLVPTSFDGAFTFQGTPVPEPSTLLLLGPGLLGLAAVSGWREVKAWSRDAAPSLEDLSESGADSA